MCVYESESVIHSVMFNSIIPWTVACQAALSMEFFSKNIGVGIPVSTPGDRPNPGIKPRSPTLQVDSLTTELSGKPNVATRKFKISLCGSY